MSGGPGAILAYGIDLGTMEDFKIMERDRYGYPELPWFDLADDFEEIALERLVRVHDPSVYGGPHNKIREIPLSLDMNDYVRKAYGVEFSTSGDLATGSTGMVLIATGSERSVEWTDTLAVDPDELARQPLADWTHRLRLAVLSLGIHPTQDRPAWLMYPYNR